MNVPLEKLDDFVPLSKDKKRSQKSLRKTSKDAKSTQVVFKKKEKENKQGYICRILDVPKGEVTEKDLIQIFKRMGRISGSVIRAHSWDIIFTTADAAERCRTTFDGARISLGGEGTTIRTKIVKPKAEKKHIVVELK